MTQLQYESLTKAQRAAVLLVALGTEAAPKILKELSENEIERITLEIANLRDIPPTIEGRVLREASEIIMAQQYITQGGVDYARKLLDKAMGKEKTAEIVRKIEGGIKATGFGLIKNIDPKQLISFIQNEHPQTIAVILTQLSTQTAAAILSELPTELQSEVVLRIATMEKISPDIIKELESVLQTQFADVGGRDMSVSGGTKIVAEIMNLVEGATEKSIMSTLEGENMELATAIKNLMFIFEDIVMLDNRAIQRVLKEVETKDLSIALKAASEEVKQKIFSNVSERVGSMIKEEMEYMGPMRLSDVEITQQKIVESIRKLQEDGQIVISGRGGKEELVV
jgi:flagellar motor switch protein FliG